MDEVDIENAEDLNELESRLYAQIHHEANGTLEDTQNGSNAVESELATAEGNTSVSEGSNRSFSKRYWASGSDGQQQQQNTKYRVRNQNKAPPPAPTLIANKEEAGTPNRKEFRIEQNVIDFNSKASSNNSTPDIVQRSNSPNEPVSNNQRVTVKSKPQREVFQRLKNPFVRREAHAKEVVKSKVNPKQGPFFKQQQKLEKVKRIEQKKQKSKKSIAKKQTTPIDIVDLVSSDESDSSDVVMIPIPPPPTFSLDDSDEENEKTNKTTALNDVTILEHEENAVDSTDVQMSSGSSSFIKPQTPTIDDKRIDNSSRCTSPCSIQSSDDFIGQKDRSRLIEAGSGMADDEDLLFLTSDVHSLLDSPQTDNSVNIINNANLKSHDGKFATPNTSSSVDHKSDYRVEGQFRAIDVYESESDITDSVYSKGATKTTVIRKIDSSSDEVEDITCSNPRTKRLRKRRRSSGNKSSDPGNGNISVNFDSANDDDDDDDDENSNSGTERTGIPFISRGPAVERKTKKRRSTLSSSTPHKTPGKASKSGHMSDGDFIAKLNDIVQGQEDEQVADSDELENTLSAREIAEKILGEKDKVVAKEVALPQNVCNTLTHVFEVIDQMENDQPKEIVATKEIIPANRQTKAVLYKSLPEEDNAQILTFVEDATPSSSNLSFMRKTAADGSPIYNVVYSRGRKLDGGLGWNDEMRKFYQDSWNGEGFVLKDVWKKMNPDRSLWKISNEDRFNKQNRRHSNLKCTNCCEFGHARFQCKRPMKPRICYMCGESGHQEPRCPNTLCLRCGNKTQFFVKSCNACSFQNRLICPICKIRGHSIDHCPDKWRRYHSTTEPNAFPNNTVVYNPRKHCSICGSRGHLADACRNAVNFMDYPILATTIKSHQKSYNDTAVKTPFSGIGYNLMYEPCLRYSFDMSRRTSNEKYYGRFLNAVGLSFLMSQKRALSTPATANSGSAKKSKRSSKTNEPLTAESNSTAPNQVPEVTESGSVDLEEPKEPECSSTEDVVESTVSDNDIQLNVVNTASTNRISQVSFKSPSKISISINPPQIMDSDSNYSFSEHFDDANASTSSINEVQQENPKPTNYKSKSRAMETLPEFIPLVDSTREDEDLEADKVEPKGISRRFVAAESEEEDEETHTNPQRESVTTARPCEAKIYLTHLHSKYLLSPDGRQFLSKAAKSCQLKVRLDFTSVGHVLVIFGLPDNQDKFQRELLLKYREISNHMQTKDLQPTPNVPKRTDVLIRFLRDDINQLLSNLGNANHLYKRLQFVERQQSKSGLKLADKLRRSLNMILVGQAGLEDGNMHLDKLMASLKTLLNDYNSDDVTPLALRSEITAHWKVIFSSYRHNNYEDLVHNYNNLISKNRIPKLIIDPLLLGHKVLDTNLTQEQREKLEQPKQSIESPLKLNHSKGEIAATPKSSKQSKRQQSLAPMSPAPSNKLQVSQAKTPFSQTIRPDNSNNNTPVKNKPSGTNLSVTPNNSSKKQQNQKIPPPPPFISNEKPSNVCTTLAELSDKWRSTCDTILTEITSKPLQRKDNNAIRESKLPSTFWSRESMRYLNECVYIAASRPELMEKIKRVQTKSKNGQLSYNDYLAVIKLHTALASK